MLENLRIAFTSIMALIVLSYYYLIIKKRKKHSIEKIFSSISVIVPAHNEEEYIKETIKSIKKADFKGKKEIIVIDDGSKDNTLKILQEIKDINIIQTKHSGKSASINKALKIASGELIAIVDADSTIEENSLIEMAKEVEMKNCAAVCCPVKVKNRKKVICMWLHLSEIYYSLIRGLLSKINANITTPGPLSVYRKNIIDEVGGFSTEGFSEDADIAIKMIRKGYHIGFTEKTSAQTNMPHTFKWFFKQRLRFARGLVNVLKRHMKLNKSIIDLYTLPIFLFSYIQSIIMGSLIIYQIITGYITYFYNVGIIFNLSVLKFFFEWFSIIGFFKWTYNVIIGTAPLTTLSIIAIISTLLSYPLYFIAFLKYDKKIDIWHLIPFCFMFPFWTIITITQIISLPEIFKKKQYNIWEKKD